MRVLIVEDDRSVSLALTGILALGGCEVEQEFDGKAGLRHLLTQKPPDLMLLDLELPQMSGCELLQRLSEQPSLMRIPVVLMTASRQVELLAPRESYRMLLHKPFELDEVLAIVAAFQPLGDESA